MGNCKYCAQPAGFLRYTHKDCDHKFNNGRNEIIEASLNAIRADGDFSGLKDRIAHVASNSYINQDEQKHLLITAWENAVDQFLDDGVLDESEEQKLAKCKNYFLLNDQQSKGPE